MATLAEILKLDSMSQVSDPRKSKTVAPRLKTIVTPGDLRKISRFKGMIVVSSSGMEAPFHTPPR